MAIASPSKVEISGSPTIEEDKVTVRIDVQDDQNRPVVDLLDTDFKVLVDGENLAFSPQDWKRPQDVVPPPAWIIILLDMSGSMGKVDSNNATKLEGALNAITQFKDTIKDRLINIPKDRIPQIAIVPFGKPGEDCDGFPITDNELSKFFPADAVLLDNHLDFLAGQKPCASTNLYEPLSKAINFFSKDPRFDFSQDSESFDSNAQPEPRLSVILLSDGFHTDDNEESDFEELQFLIRQNPQIIIHTLGYGLTPEELGKKYKIGGPANRSKIHWDSDSKLPKGKVPAEEFVDQGRLTQIAQLTGGITEFSADSDLVAEKLQLFLTALLGAYEISYWQPNADRSSMHSVQAIIETNESSIQSNEKEYRIIGFGRTLERGPRIVIFLAAIAMLGLAGCLPFYIWSNNLKNEDF